MPLLTIPKVDVPVLGPGDPITISPLHAPRAAAITIDVRTTGLLYHNDDTPNDLSVPYSVALVASILDDENKFVPYDALAFRIAVPGYLTIDTDLTTLMTRLEGVAYHMSDTSVREKARQAAQLAFAAEAVPIPFMAQTKETYDAENLEHGVSQPEAAQLIQAFVSRFQGGAIIVGQNLRLVLEMLDRIGFKLDVEKNVYHRMVELYSIFLASSIGSGFSGIPSLLEVIDVPEDEQKNPLARAQYATTYLASLVGTGSLPGTVYPIDSTVAIETNSNDHSFVVLVGNTGLEEATITASIVGDEFTSSTESFTIAGGETTAFPVDFSAAQDGTYTGTITFNDGTNSVDVAAEVQLASA